MTPKRLHNFLDEIFAKPPKKVSTTNKTVVCHIDNIWNLGSLDLNDYGAENIRGNIHVLVVIGKFSKLFWKFRLKMKTL